MSLSDVRTFYKARLNFLGLKEHTSWNDDQNVPENIINHKYMVTLGLTNQLSFSQSHAEWNVPSAIKVFVKGYRDELENYDRAVTLADQILNEILKPSNRLTQACIKTIDLDGVSFDPLSATNDNTVTINIQFRNRVSFIPT